MEQNEQTSMKTMPESEIEEINSILSGMPTETDVIEDPEIEVESETVLADDDLLNLDLDIERAESYASQEAVVIADPAAAPGTAATTAAKTPKAPKAPRTAQPRAPRDLVAIDAGFFVLEGDIATMSDAEKEAAKTDLIANMPKQVKVAEKAENLIQAIAAGRKPSTYTVTAFSALLAAKKLNTADLVAALKASGVGEGTARSQAGQMMTLMPFLKITTRAGRDLELNPNSNIVRSLSAILA